MSAESLPITSTRFAKALEDLPLSALYGKVAEIRNSIAHLQKSNNELEEYARQEDDKDCYEALLENREVIQRMEERIELVKREVTEVRGLMWEPEGENKEREREDQAGRPTNETGTDVRMRDAGSTNATNTTATTNGTAQEQSNGAASAQEEEGVFL